MRWPALACIAVVLLATGCASRRLDLPSVIDRSGELRPRAAPGSVTVTPDGRTQLYTARRGDTIASVATRFATTPADLASWNNLAPDAPLVQEQVLRVSPPPTASAAPVDASSAAAVATPIGNDRIDQRPIDNGATSTPVTPTPAGNAPIKSSPLGVKRPYSEAAYADLLRPDTAIASSASSTSSTSVASATPQPSSAVPGVAAVAPPTGLGWIWPANGKVTGTFASGKNNGINIAGNAGDPVVAAADGKVTFAGTGVRGYGNFVIVRHTPELLSVYAHNRTNLVKEGATVAKGQRIAEMGNSDAQSVGLHFEIRSDSKPIDPMKYLPER